GIDVAASELWNAREGKYIYKNEGVKRDREEQIEYISQLAKEFEIYYIEDPLEQNDFEGFAELTKRIKALICGDDLYVTKVERLEMGLEKGSTNAILIKPNQCGTLTDTFKAVSLAKSKEIVPVFSHRSGETTDETISHLAVGFRCPIIKTGVVGGERIAKLNELIRIEESLGEKAKMAKLP
ncbi:MAG: phosphopyruvate hydratase, partial [Thermoplasmata archaeon]